MKRSKHSLTHWKLMSAYMGNLIPVTWYEVLPGDTIQHSTSVLTRLAPIVAPIMHPCHISVAHWFVPLRLIWRGSGSTPDTEATGGFENFITGGPNGLDSTIAPYVSFAAAASQDTLPDWLGIPTANWPGGSVNFSALPFRAYQLIWNEFYRDQDLQTAAVISVGDGADSTTSQAAQEVCWNKDYLTTARPWASKGNAITIPLEGRAGVIGIGELTAGNAASQTTYWDQLSSSVQTVNAWTASLALKSQTTGAPSASNLPQVYANLQAGLQGDAQVPGLDPEVFRQYMAMFRFQEMRARFGSRYAELLRQLGVRNLDSRLQRPEYLGGGRSTVQFSEVMQTAPTTSGTQQPGVGQYGGHGISGLRTNRFRRFFPEHGIVMTCYFFRPISVYAQMVERKWMRGVPGWTGMLGNRYDYWTREFENIGQQVVVGMEADASVGLSTQFGWQDRYDEYRRILNSVAGGFRISGQLDIWNMAREFGSPPALNSTFVGCLPSNRGFADLSHAQLYLMCQHSIQARRLVRKSGGTSYVR